MNDRQKQKAAVARRMQERKEVAAGLVKAVLALYPRKLDEALSQALSLAANPTRQRVATFKILVQDLNLARRELAAGGIKPKGLSPDAIRFLRVAHEFTHDRLDRLKLFRAAQSYMTARNASKEVG